MKKLTSGIRELKDDIEAHIDDRKASMRMLKELGYERTNKKVKVRLTREDGTGTDTFTVYELKHSDGDTRPVTFSFMYVEALEDGVILPFPFSRYEKP